MLSSKTLRFFLASLLISITISEIAFAMADQSSASTATAEPESAVHIVYTEQPQNNEEPEAYHIRTLASVLGSEEAAKEALLYSYKTAASGFSAKLTPDQVAQISSKSLFPFVDTIFSLIN
ncbi:hypothetical protein CsatB_018983 [Cannabis sativa]